MTQNKPNEKEDMDKLVEQINSAFKRNIITEVEFHDLWIKILIWKELTKIAKNLEGKNNK